MLKSIKVGDYMITHQVKFDATTDLFSAIDLLLEHRIAAAPVVDDQGRLVGLLDQASCLQGILSGAYYEETGGTVGSCMQTSVESVSPRSSVIEVAQRLLGQGCRTLPVVEDGQLLGQISPREVLLAVKEFAQREQSETRDE